MRAEDRLVDAVRVHARDDGEPLCPRGAREVAEQVAVAELLGAILERVLARVVRGRCRPR
jgi:hypothetical protein